MMSKRRKRFWDSRLLLLWPLVATETIAWTPARTRSRHSIFQLRVSQLEVNVGLLKEDSIAKADDGLEHRPPLNQRAPLATDLNPTQRSLGLDLPYSSALRALQAYHEDHGDLVIPRRYVVPIDADTYPPEWRGVYLARTVYNMRWWQRNVKQRPERVAQLNRLGFVWQRLQPEWNLVLEALITYSSLNGDVMVPFNFVVPENSDWPKATWKIPLGSCVHRMRLRHDFLRGPSAGSRRDQLDGLGFVWDVSEHKFRLFFTALRYYAKLETNGATGLLKVPNKFVVPKNDLRWPEELWGYPLGDKCVAVRQKQLYVKNNNERKAALESIGFPWNGNADLGWLRVVHAAAIYSRLHERNLDVPLLFMVPKPPSKEAMVDADGYENDWPWPEYLWGLPLGQRLKDIRVKGAYLKGPDAVMRRRQLDTLGFVWKPRRGRRRQD